MKLKAHSKKTFALFALGLTLISCSKQTDVQHQEVKTNLNSQINEVNNSAKLSDYSLSTVYGVVDKYLDKSTNKIVINPNGATVFEVGLSVDDVNSSTPTSKFYVVHVNSQNVETIISRITTVNPSVKIFSTTVECTLPAGTTTDGRVYLRVEIGTVENYLLGKSYGLIDNGTGDHTAKYYVDGKFYHNTGDGKVYVCMEGKYRYIQSTNTLYGVFKTNPELNPISGAVFNAYFLPLVGETVGPSARIVMDNYTSKIYYQENGILRYITSRAAAERWSLDIEKRQYMNGTGSLTFGPNI